MRSIKFRAWDKDFKRMLPNAWPTGRGLFWDDGSSFDALSDRYEIMQFTGLVTKLGVEIYEGDIIRTYCAKYPQYPDKYYLNGKPLRVVQWVHSNHHNGWNFYSVKKAQYEIVGNIYEHPELLR